METSWVTVDGKTAHRRCVDNYNSTIACGVDHGDCRDPSCCISERYAGPPGRRQQLCIDLVAAWLALPREERARRLGQELTEHQDGCCVRLSHDDGVQGSGVYGHVGASEEEIREALARLRAS